MMMIMDPDERIKKYSVLYDNNGKWETILSSENSQKIKIHRFEPVFGKKVKLLITEFTKPPTIAEVGIYNEQR
jgi:alpha-L-fucosidase